MNLTVFVESESYAVVETVYDAVLDYPEETVIHINSVAYRITGRLVDQIHNGGIGRT